MKNLFSTAASKIANRSNRAGARKVSTRTMTASQQVLSGPVAVACALRRGLDIVSRHCSNYENEHHVKSVLPSAMEFIPDVIRTGFYRIQ